MQPVADLARSFLRYLKDFVMNAKTQGGISGKDIGKLDPKSVVFNQSKIFDIFREVSSTFRKILPEKAPKDVPEKIKL